MAIVAPSLNLPIRLDVNPQPCALDGTIGLQCHLAFATFSLWQAAIGHIFDMPTIAAFAEAILPALLICSPLAVIATQDCAAWRLRSASTAQDWNDVCARELTRPM
ncbi:hypothetical protein SKA58_15567 [Sphingomonas sp. SKA58]|nr:hypothetical protein SKA58_15567 [Sphingomonas sp. SKA58]